MSKKRQTYRKFALSFLLCLTLNSVASAQLWTRSYDLGGNATPTSFRILADGGYIVAGHITYDFTRQQTGWIARLNENGDMLWSRHYEVENGNGYFNSIISLPTGGYIAAGGMTTVSETVTKQKYSVNHAWLVRIQETGDTLWTRHYGSLHSTYLNDISLDTDETIVATGGTLLEIVMDANGMRPVVMKVAFNGDLLWMKTTEEGNEGMRIDRMSDGRFLIATFTTGRGFMGFSYTSSLGASVIEGIGRTKYSNTFLREGFATERAYKMEIRSGAFQCRDNSTLVYGMAVGKSKSQNGFCGWIVKSNEKLDTTIWSHTYGSGRIAQILDAIETDDGVVFVGRNYVDSSAARIWIGKIDNRGKLMWERCFPSINRAIAVRVLETSDKGLAVLCQETGNLDVMRFDAEATINKK